MDTPKIVRNRQRLFVVLILMSILITAAGYHRDGRPAAAAGAPSQPVEIPYELVSQDSLIATLQDLTSIQAYSGWRSAATQGEVEALEYVARRLGQFEALGEQGMQLERQSFDVFMSTEFWETRLRLTVGGRVFEAPAEGLRGSRWIPRLALIMDSDGRLNDSERNPLVAEGPVVLVQTEKTLNTLKPAGVQGRVLFVNYALLDSFVEADATENGARLAGLIDQGAAGVVLVTQFSTRSGESHGTMAGEGSIFQSLEQPPARRVPILHTRLEDLAVAGISGWQDFAAVQAARLVWDTDVRSPAQAGSLIARIPGLDSSRAVILGAHIDSPNNPGAMDNGSGSAALLEIARVLNEAQTRPAVDLYLAWFGGHELGGYGSAYFAATHPELLDRTLAMLQVDCLGHPQDGKPASISVSSTSYDRFGEDRLAWPDTLARLAAGQGVSLARGVEYGLIADNSNFDAFNVPNVDLIYFDQADYKNRGNAYIHYSMHWHDPYDTVELAGEVGDVLVEMTRIALAAALETGRSQETYRAAPPAGRRALFVASHTATLTIPTSMLRDLGMALAWEGFDVDIVPYGQALRPSDLERVDLVVLPPTLDYRGQPAETWSAAELGLLDGYMRDGGLLVFVNSGYNFVMLRQLDDPNEDGRALNPLLEPLGVRLLYGATGADIVRAVAEHPLMKDAGYLTQFAENGVPFRMKSGQVLARSAGMPMIGLVDVGERGGQLLVIADVGLLQANDHARNLNFIQNLARYARERR